MQEHNRVAARAVQRQAARRTGVGCGLLVFMVRIAFIGDDERLRKTCGTFFRQFERWGSSAFQDQDDES
jgi:hypothetical protein